MVTKSDSGSFKLGSVNWQLAIVNWHNPCLQLYIHTPSSSFQFILVENSSFFLLLLKVSLATAIVFHDVFGGSATPYFDSGHILNAV